MLLLYSKVVFIRKLLKIEKGVLIRYQILGVFIIANK